MPYPRLEATHYIDYWKSDLHLDSTYFWSNEYVNPMPISDMDRNYDGRLTIAIGKIKYKESYLQQRQKYNNPL